MALDLIARAAAGNATAAAGNASAAAGQALAASAPAFLFTALGTRTIDAAITVLTSSGYATAGQGIGTYVSDAAATAALAAAHPRLCKASANGRYFRLVASGAAAAISVAQAGATATAGTNDQPAIQAAVAYASAVGIHWVDFPAPAYELWCPIRTSPNNTHAIDGHPITITAITGLGLRGLPGGTRLTLKNSNGGSKNTITQTIADEPWQGGGVYVLPGGYWPSPNAKWVAMENLIIDGGVTYTPGNLTNTCLNDKGFLVQDINCEKVLLRNVEMRNFAGEIYYSGGDGIGHQQLENVVLNGSPQSALNVGTASGTCTAINLKAGNSYQPAEVLGGAGFTMIGGLFHDGSTTYITGGPNQFQGGWPYYWPFRDPAKQPPWMRFIGTVFENTTVFFGSYTQFLDPVFTDASLYLSSQGGRLTDVIGRIISIADQGSGGAAVYIAGPQNLTTQVPNSPVGTYAEPPKNIMLDIVCKRTALAAAAGRTIDGLCIQSGLIDPTCQFRVSGEARQSWFHQDAPPAGAIQPRVVLDDGFIPVPGGQRYGGTYDYLDADKVYSPRWPAMTLFNNGTAARTITLNTAYGHSHGQTIIFYKGEAAGNPIRFPAAGAGLALDRTYTLKDLGDHIELAYNADSGKWHLSRIALRGQQVLSAAQTYDAPSLASGSSITTTVTVTGAALGDFAQAALGISAAGLVVSAAVTAADVVTVVLANLSGAAIDLASTSLTVQVSKQ